MPRPLPRPASTTTKRPPATGTCAFTLIELLVVVTIIVVLLALLTPALDRAIYQAELAVCGTTLHSLAGSVQTYTLDFKRHYPYRYVTYKMKNERPNLLTYNSPFAGGNQDDRPLYRTFLSINKQLNCALVKAVDLDGSGAITLSFAFSSYALWFGWRYQVSPEQGMYRLGDRFTWTEPDGRVYRFSYLASDFEYVQVGGSDSNSHPDRDKMVPSVFQDQSIFGAGDKHTFSCWVTTSPPRGEVDNNFVLDDGSVRRVNGIKSAAIGDPQMVVMPASQDGTQANWKTHLPKE